MLIGQNMQNVNNLGGLGGIINEAEKLLDKTQSMNPTKPLNMESEDEEAQKLGVKERVTYGLVSLEIMSDEQYKAFERVTAGMSHNEKISVAQILTRAGNLSTSVEHIKAQEQEVAKQNEKSAQSSLGFLGVSEEGWREIAKEFQENLNHIEGIYTKNYNRNLTSNYNDILQRNTEAKTQRILREFSHAIYSGNATIDTIG